MNDFSKIINPLTNEKLSIFSSSGKNLLKNYVKLYKNGGQVGGVAPALEFDSINLNFTLSLVLIIIPQAFKYSVAPTISFLIQIIKGTSLAYIIGFQDLMLLGKRWANAPVPGSEPFIIFPIMAVMYFCLCYPLAVYAKHLEKKILINN